MPHDRGVQAGDLVRVEPSFGRVYRKAVRFRRPTCAGRFAVIFYIIQRELLGFGWPQPSHHTGQFPFVATLSTYFYRQKLPFWHRLRPMSRPVCHTTTRYRGPVGYLVGGSLLTKRS